MIKRYQFVCNLICAFAVMTFMGTTAYAAENEPMLISEAPEEEVVEEEVLPDLRVIPKGIYIDGADVSGMTVDDANQVVEQRFAKYDDIVFTLRANDKEVTATRQDLGLCAKNKNVTVQAATYGTCGNLMERFMASKDIEAGRRRDFVLETGCDIAQLMSFLETACQELDIEPVNNYLKKNGEEFTFCEGESGIVVMQSKSASDIANYIENEWDEKDHVFDLSTEVKEPLGTREELAEIKDLLGSCTTDYSTSSASRKQNVSNGVSFINGSTLYPGEQLSVSNTISPMTAENGYALAGSYENGTTVETYGGGICQVSSTLYGAVRGAELGVETRACHSMIVTYVEPSMDAAIAEGIKDFILWNNKDYPVYIEGYTTGSKVVFNIYGKEDRDPGHKAVYVSEIESVTPQSTQWVADGALPLGQMKRTSSGHVGCKARLWKIIVQDGVEESRKVYNNSTYNASARVVHVGTACDDSSVAAAMTSAVNSQDANTIRDAIATYAPGVVNSVPFEVVPSIAVTGEPGPCGVKATSAPAEAPAEGLPQDPNVVAEPAI